MKRLALVVLAACGGAPAKPAAPPPHAPPPITGSREDFARGFVAAVAARDRAAIDRFVDADGFCDVVVAEQHASRDLCISETKKDVDEVIPQYEQLVATSFVPGDVSTLQSDPGKGLWIFTVVPKGGTAEQGVLVVVVEHGGARFVVFPRKKD